MSQKISLLKQGYAIYRNDGFKQFLVSCIHFFYYRIVRAASFLYYFTYTIYYEQSDGYCGQTITTTTESDGGTCVSYDGAYAVSTDRSNGQVDIWNLNQPSNPRIKDSVNVPTANHLVSENGKAYITQREGNSILHVIDVKSAEVESTVKEDEFPYTYGVDIDTKLNIAAVADRSGKVATVDITDPTSAQILDKVDGSELDGATQLEIVDKYIIVGGKDSSTIVVIDASDPADLCVTNIIRDPRLVVVDGFEYRDGYLYTASGSTWNSGLEPEDINWQLNIIDLSDPESPKFIGQRVTDELAQCYGLEIRGDYAYASAIDNSQIVMFDISDKSDPQIAEKCKRLEFYRVHWLDINADIGVSISTNGRLTTFQTKINI